MNNSKSKSLYVAAALIILVVFNLVAFLLPFNREGLFWAGYGFTMAAILLAAYVSFYVLKREDMKSKFYGFPIILVAWIYLIVQLAVGIAEMALSFIPAEYGIVVNAVLLGACLIGLISVKLGEAEIRQLDGKVKEKVFYIKSLQADVEALVGMAADETAKKALKDLAEAIRFSDPMSSLQLAAIENKIEAKVAALREAVGASDFAVAKSLCDETQMLISERNRKCKLLK